MNREAAVAWARANMDGRPVPVEMLRVVAAEDPQRALSLYEELNGFGRKSADDELGEFAGRLMAQDPPAAQAWIEARFAGEQSEKLIKGAVQTLHWRAPDRLIELMVSGHPFVTGNTDWRSVLSYGSRMRSDEEVLGLLDRVPADQEAELRGALMSGGYLEATREHLLARLEANNGWQDGAVLSLLMRDQDALHDVLGEVSDEARGRAVNRMAESYAGHYPEFFLELAELVQDRSDLDRAGLQTSLAALAQADPDRAIAEVESLPAGEARTMGIITIVSNLVIDDPGRALEWLNQQRSHLSSELPNRQPDPFSQTSSLRRFVEELRSEHPWEAERIDALFGTPDESE